jgi:hypothetical protein
MLPASQTPQRKYFSYGYIRACLRTSTFTSYRACTGCPEVCKSLKGHVIFGGGFRFHSPFHQCFTRGAHLARAAPH